MTGCIYRAASLGVASLVLVAGCAAPSARLAGVSFKDIDLQSLTVVFDVELTNPNSAPLPLADLDYELSSRGNSFFTGQAPLQGDVPAQGTRTISLPAQITYSQILTALADVKPGAVLPYKADLGLSIRVPVIGKLRLPIHKEGKLPVPAAPGVELLDIKWDKLTLDSAGGVFNIRVTNHNQFPIEMARMAYGLTLGKMEVARSSLASPVSLDPNGGAGIVEIPISFSPRKFGLAALGMLTGDSGYRLGGEISVKTPYGPMSLPFDRSGNIRLRR